MSMATLERAVLAGAKWSTGEIEAGAGEVIAYVKDPGVFVVVKNDQDKRHAK